MKFTFPDSGREIEIEGYSNLTASLLRGWYENNYRNKPVEPKDPLEETSDGNVSSPEFKAKQEQYLKDKDQYAKDLALWTTSMSLARWAGTKLYYASCVVNPDTKAVEKSEYKFLKLPPHIDLREAIREGYKELGVEFDEDYMDSYIYLFHVCIASAGDQTLFEDMLMTGSAPTQEAVQTALFRFRGKI